MEITHKLEMDLEIKAPMQWLELPQGDVNTRKIRFLLTANQMPWTVPEDATVLIRYCKPDGTEGEYDTLPDGTVAWEAVDNTLTVALAPQVLTAAGAVILYAVIRVEDMVLNTFAVEPAGAVLELTFDLGVAADATVVVMTYKNNAWGEIAGVKNNGDGIDNNSPDSLSPLESILRLYHCHSVLEYLFLHAHFVGGTNHDCQAP